MLIALLEDETHHAHQVRGLIESANDHVTIFQNGDDLVAALALQTFDVFVLDWRVPGADGMKVLHHIREIKSIKSPVMFLTSRLDEHYATAALAAGADDYCTKPIRAGEFLARMGALSRRLTPDRLCAEADTEQDILGYHFTPASYRVVYGETSRTLNEHEFKLAQFMFRHAESPVSRERLITEVWCQPFNDETIRSLDKHMSRVRKQLNLGSQSQQLRIKPLYGYGYRLVAYTQEDYVS